MNAGARPGEFPAFSEPSSVHLSPQIFSRVEKSDILLTPAYDASFTLRSERPRPKEGKGIVQGEEAEVAGSKCGSARKYVARREHRVQGPLAFLQNLDRFVRHRSLARSLRRRAARVVPKIDWRQASSSHMNMSRRCELSRLHESSPPRISHETASPSSGPQPCANPQIP